tara:strand:+ start:494 stop:877 length:384 start_codon:yes stop_codon:yes gene_type:complete
MKIINKSLFTNKSFFVFISLFSIISILNDVKANLHNLTNLRDIDFEKVINNISAEFHEYENASNLFDDFFGANNQKYESEFKINYQDLKLQIDSKNLRELYKTKLLEMKEENKINDKKKWSFFNKKI